jgi:hypothetical protein
MNLYTLTRKSIYDPNPTKFLENLYSFIGNNIYDDGCFIVEYYDYPDGYYQTEDYLERLDKFGFDKYYVRKLNGVFKYDSKIMSNWEPSLRFINDMDENATQNPDFILSAIKFLEDEKEYRKQWDEKMRKYIRDMEEN